MMAWSDGANGLANILSTTIGSKSTSLKTALIIGSIFVVLGAFLGGAHVTNTIRTGILDLQSFPCSAHLYIIGMIAVSISSMSFVMTCSYFGMPVSITDATVGSLIGFGGLVLGIKHVYWGKVGIIIGSWVVAPLFAGFLSYWFFIIIRTMILATDDPAKSVKRVMPFLFFLVGLILAIITVLKDLSHFHIYVNFWQRFEVVLGCALLVTVLGYIFTRKITLPDAPKRYHRFDFVEKYFAVLMAFTACALVFGLGSNDLAVIIGPFASVVSAIKSGGNLMADQPIPIWAMQLACSAVILGLWVSGKKVIETVGDKITTLTPTRAFSATIAAVFTVVCTTNWGIPVSVTHILVGGVFGVGLARGLGALNIRVMRHIFLSWIVTLPATAVLAIVFFELLKMILR